MVDEIVDDAVAANNAVKAGMEETMGQVAGYATNGQSNATGDGSMGVDSEGRKIYPYIPQGRNMQDVLTVMSACVSAGVPLVLVGLPGGGKTSLVQAAATAMKRNLNYVSMATMSIEDISGVMHAVPDKKGRLVTKYALPWWEINVLDDDEKATRGEQNGSILFLDEMNTANPSVQKAFLPILAGSHFPSGDTFTKNTAIIGAMNPTALSDGDELSEAMKNRICFIAFEPDGADVSDGFQNRWRSYTPMKVPTSGKTAAQAERDEKRLAKIVDEHVQKHYSGNYTRMREDDDSPYMAGVVKGDLNEEFIFEQAFASQRSWDNMVKILSHLNFNNIDANQHQIEMVINGTIGRIVGQKFFNDLRSKLKNLVSLKDFLKYDDVNEIDLSGYTINQMAKIWTEMVEYLKKAKGRDPNVKKIYDLAIHIKNSGSGDLFQSHTFTNDMYKGAFFKKIAWEKLDADGNVVRDENGKPVYITNVVEMNKREHEYRNYIQKVVMKDIWDIETNFNRNQKA